MESGLYLVSTPIGNLGDLSRRARETLAGVETIYAEDTRRTGVLLDELGIDGSLRSLHEHNEAERAGEILDRLAEGAALALVSDAGTPSVSDPGRRVVAAALEEGHRVAAVPGPSAVTAALSVSGLPADRFAFLGFPPRGGEERDRWMRRSADLPVTAVIFESPRRLSGLLEEWEERGLGDRECVVARELTKKFEEVRRATVSRLRMSYEGEQVRGEVTLVLAAAEPVDWREREEEIRERLRAMARDGHSTRDMTRRLQEEFDVPRNDAYEMALEARGSDG